MSEETLDLLKTLSATPGPVGRETLVQDIVKEHFKEHCGGFTQDRIGNVVGTLEGGVDKHYAIVAHRVSYVSSGTRRDTCPTFDSYLVSGF
ncbi:MAG: hypothetical protein ACXACG_09215 [Candidatus Thorarchaeota archaeon]|jgi:putative aminopeptidase FrvX